MTNYCVRFIPDYSTKTEPLRKLTHKDQTWEWTPQHDRAVNELKDALVKAPVTAFFDPAKDTELSVDANPVGLAAILSQAHHHLRQSFLYPDRTALYPDGTRGSCHRLAM